MTTSSFVLFLAATSLIAITPGPGIMYVAAQTLKGGRAAGIAASVGTWTGGLVHVCAGAVGVSALVLASADAFAAFKLVGAGYLIWLGIKTWRRAGIALEIDPADHTCAAPRALRDGIVVEALNPKSATFFLAFLPQFVSPAEGYVALQFVALGLITVTLNTAVDIVVTLFAARMRQGVSARPRLLRRIQQMSASVFVTLGVSLALSRRPT
jgi:threonine/homoserine/homoserine lactone efflux protein